jgi:DNA-binding NtrC family response regulator
MTAPPGGPGTAASAPASGARSSAAEASQPGSEASAAPPPFRARPDRPFRDQVDDAERDILITTLAFTRDNVTEAARLLDLERGHFYKKLKSLGLRRGREDGGGPAVG